MQADLPLRLQDNSPAGPPVGAWLLVLWLTMSFAGGSWIAAFSHKRYLICLFCFFATCCAYVERTGFSVAFTSLCRQEKVDERIEGMVMGAFYWGYGLSQVPGGFLAQRFGGRLMLIVSFTGWTIASFLTPRTATNALGMSAARVIVGIPRLPHPLCPHRPLAVGAAKRAGQGNLPLHVRHVPRQCSGHPVPPGARSTLR